MLLHIMHHLTKFDVLVSKGLEGSTQFMKWLMDERKRLTDTSNAQGPSCSPSKILFSYIQDFVSKDPFSVFFTNSEIDVNYKPNNLMDIEFFTFPVRFCI